MTSPDPYTELELPGGASAAAVQAAYERLLKQYDPDSGDSPDAARMLRVTRAYHELTSGAPPAEAAWLGARSYGSGDAVRRLLDEAEAAADANNWVAVQSAVREVLRLDPTNVVALLYEAERAGNAGEWREAGEIARRILEIAADNQDALLYAADGAATDGNWLEARGLAATVLVLAPDNAYARQVWDEAQDELGGRAF